MPSRRQEHITPSFPRPPAAHPIGASFLDGQRPYPITQPHLRQNLVPTQS